MSGPRENAVLAGVMAYLTTRGDCFVWRNNTGAVKLDAGYLKFGKVGSADIIGVLSPSGRFIAIECKRPKGGVLAREQQEFGETVTEAGGIYVIARSVADVEAALPPVTKRLTTLNRRVIPR
jgi:hypothetical protein